MSNLMYSQQLRRHGDIIKRTVGGFIVVEGRADDTMNLGGIKVSCRTNIFPSFGHSPISTVAQDEEHKGLGFAGYII